MPKKIRELKSMLRKAGWVLIPGGKGSHTKWSHAKMPQTLILAGHDGDDAQKYQESFVKRACEETKSKESES